MAKATFFTQYVGVRLHETTAQWLQERAHAQRLHPSALARQILERAARQDLELEKDRQDGQQD